MNSYDEIQCEELNAIDAIDHQLWIESMENDGQPDEYTEWQDYMGGDDWDHGQYDEVF